MSVPTLDGVHHLTLPGPDGHELRFYGKKAHTTLEFGKVLVVDDARQSAQAAELIWLAERGLPAVPDGSVPAPPVPAHD